MQQCCLLDICGFYGGGFRAHAQGESLLSDYCFGTPQFCAINLVRKCLEDGQVPHDLMPYDLGRLKHLF